MHAHDAACDGCAVCAYLHLPNPEPSVATKLWHTFWSLLEQGVYATANVVLAPFRWFEEGAARAAPQPVGSVAIARAGGASDDARGATARVDGAVYAITPIADDPPWHEVRRGARLVGVVHPNGTLMPRDFEDHDLLVALAAAWSGQPPVSPWTGRADLTAP